MAKPVIVRNLRYRSCFGITYRFFGISERSGFSVFDFRKDKTVAVRCNYIYLTETAPEVLLFYI